MKDPDIVNITSGSDTLPLIFIDHVAYGSPLKPPGKPDVICEDFYADSIDKVRKKTFSLKYKVLRKG